MHWVIIQIYVTVTGTNFIAESTYCEIGNVIIQAVSVASTTQIICNVVQTMVQTKPGNYSVVILKIMDYMIHILVVILQIHFCQNYTNYSKLWYW